MASARAIPAKRSRTATATLKRRSDFLRVRKGARWAMPLFVLEARKQDGEESAGASDEPQPRFGFTVTRQVGNAVERNRIRRRLKAAVGNVGADHARGGFDYVLIARRPALTSPFGALVDDLIKAFERVHRARGKAR
jgi:ribonuclease P protein component